MKRFLILFAALALSVGALSGQTPGQASHPDTTRFQPDESRIFARYDTLALAMDIYFPEDDAPRRPCIIYSYGGGFIHRNQRHFDTRKLCRMLADEGYVVIASDYRLGLQGVQYSGAVGMVRPLENAILMATEDVMKVTRHALDFAPELGVDPLRIILMGSSAGAIASLQCDFERCGGTSLAQQYLPEGFRYAGVVAFAGAIFSRRGLGYPHDMPAPTLFLHGTADRLVPYRQIKLFGIGFYGSDRIAAAFRNRHYPHKIIRYTDEGHTVAARYFSDYEQIGWFIDRYVKQGRHLEIDETFSDPFREKSPWDTADPAGLYR